MKLGKKRDRHCVSVCISRCEDNDGRFFFVSVKTDDSATNRNAVWVKDYKSAMEFAQKFFEQEGMYSVGADGTPLGLAVGAKDSKGKEPSQKGRQQ